MGNVDWIEYLGVTASLVISVALSFSTSRKESLITRSPSRISIVPIIMSLIASFNSGVSLLGKPAESYAYGIDFTCFNLAVLIINMILLNVVYMPVVDTLKTASIYEYFDYRFDARIRKLVSIVFIITRILQTSIAVLPPAFVISKYIDVDFLIIGLSAVTTFYTMIGGFKGVVRTDAFQAVIMFLSMAILCVLSVFKVGGLERVFEIAYSTGRLSPPKASIDPTDRISIWTYLAFMDACSTMLLNQSSYQRMKALSSIKEMRIALTSQLLGMIAFTIASCFIGLSIHAYYFGCDPKEANLVHTTSDVVLLWINEVGQQVYCLRGIYLAGITCASVSTISTNLNTVTELVCKEVWKGSTNKHVRIATITVGALATAVAIFFKNASSLVEITFAFISLDGITSGLFILGMIIIPANTKGALTSGIFSMFTTLLFALGSRYYNTLGSLKPYPIKPTRTDLCSFNITRQITSVTPQTAEKVFYLFRISPFFYAVIAVTNTVLIGTIVSLVFRNKTDDKSRKAYLFSPLVHRFLPKLLPTNQNNSGKENMLLM